MNQSKISFALMVLSAIFLVSCGKSPPPQTSQSSQPPQAQQSAQPPKPEKLTIKGFYMGMPMEDATRQAQEVFGHISVYSPDEALLNQIKQKVNGDVFTANGDNNEIDLTGLEGDSRLIFDANQKTLKKIILSPAALNQAFDASALSPSDFAQKFSEAYHIQLESRNDPEQDAVWQNHWRYVSPNGDFVLISQQKKLLTWLKGDAKKTQGNFN